MHSIVAQIIINLYLPLISSSVATVLEWGVPDEVATNQVVSVL